MGPRLQEETQIIQETRDKILPSRAMQLLKKAAECAALFQKQL
jgi:hypothetical protein